MISGIDVSSYQTTHFPTSGNDFAFIKATEGTTYVNPNQNGQTYTGREAGLVLGFYHYLHGGNYAEQAQFFVDKCASIPGDILAVDWEESSVSCANKDFFLKTVKRLRPKHKVILYCNRDFWLHHDNTSFCQDGLWIADPNHVQGKPGIMHHWDFHQYGVRGNTDQDVANFSSRNALRTWAHDLL